MKQFEQFSNEQTTHRNLKIPQSVIRTVSLEKIRKKSLQNRNLNQLNIQQKQNKPLLEKKCNDEIYEKILQKKLTLKPDVTNIKNLNGTKLKVVKLQERSQKLYEDYNRRQQKKKLKQKQYQIEKLKQCTFKPKILTQTDNRRSLKQFLNFQEAYYNRKTQRIDNLKNQILKQNQQIITFKPQINHKNVQTTNQNVHERLFQLSKIKHSIEKQQKLNSYDQVRQRKISINQPIERFTSRQLRKASSIKSIARNNTQKSQNQSHKKQKIECSPVSPISSNNQKHIILKILKQVMQACSLLTIQSHHINYLEFSDLMTVMHFVQQQTSVNYIERKYIYQIWNLLGGQSKQYIELYNLLKIILSIIGIHNIKLFEKIINQSPYGILKLNQPKIYQKTQLKNIGYFLGNQYIIDDKESKKIKKQFEILYSTRLHREKTKVTIEQNFPTFKPEILQSSKGLAEKFRNKILQQTAQLIKNKEIQYKIPQNGEINHVDLLFLQKKAIEIKLKKNREQKSTIQQQKFQISRNSNSNISNNSFRYLDLYALSNNNKFDRRDRTADQIEAQKYKQQLTFKPNLIHEKVNSWQPMAKDIDKAVFRMYQARRLKQKQQNQNIQNVKNRITVKNKTQNRQKGPILFLNINIDNNRMEKLFIYQDDDPVYIAQEFASKFNLDLPTKQRLIKLIKTQIQQVFENIRKVNDL